MALNHSTTRVLRRSGFGAGGAQRNANNPVPMLAAPLPVGLQAPVLADVSPADQQVTSELPCPGTPVVTATSVVTYDSQVPTDATDALLPCLVADPSHQVSDQVASGKSLQLPIGGLEETPEPAPSGCESLSTCPSGIVTAASAHLEEEAPDEPSILPPAGSFTVPASSLLHPPVMQAPEAFSVLLTRQVGAPPFLAFCLAHTSLVAQLLWTSCQQQSAPSPPSLASGPPDPWIPPVCCPPQVVGKLLLLPGPRSMGVRSAL